MLFALLFIAAGGVVVAAGTALAKYGDAIAQRTRFGGLWIGAVLLSTATSLPELGTDVAAVRMGAPDLAVGDLFGSSMANMLILAVIDLLPPRREVLRTATLDHALAACLAMTLNAAAAASILAPSGLTFGGVAVESVGLAGLYVVGTRAVFRQAMRDFAKPAEAAARPSQVQAPQLVLPTLRRAIVGFGIAALIILLAAPAFAFSAKGLAEATGLGTTFVGTWLVGFATSLPELVASIAAVRLRAFDLAVGNLFGSNAFNMSILLWLDVAHPGPSIFTEVRGAHALTGMFAVILMAMGLAAIVYRAPRRFRAIEPDSALIVVGYVVALALLYLNRGMS